MWHLLNTRPHDGKSSSIVPGKQQLANTITPVDEGIQRSQIREMLYVRVRLLVDFDGFYKISTVDDSMANETYLIQVDTGMLVNGVEEMCKGGRVVGDRVDLLVDRRSAADG